MIQLIPIERGIDISTITEEPMKSSLELTLEFYEKVGFVKPWISYLAKFHETYAGICAFKGAPVNNKVELAYYTFPSYEGMGIATRMCKGLIAIARDEDASIIITARTLPEENASTSVLTKNGFRNAGTMIDPEDGEVYEWIL